MPTSSYLKDLARYKARIRKLRRNIRFAEKRIGKFLQMIEILREREPNQWFYFYRDGGKLVHCGQSMLIHASKTFCRCKECGKIISLKPYADALLSPKKREAARLLHLFRKSIAQMKLKQIVK